MAIVKVLGVHNSRLDWKDNTAVYRKGEEWHVRHVKAQVLCVQHTFFTMVHWVEEPSTESSTGSTGW